MSVVFLVTSKSNRDHRELIPVAPQEIFVSRWLPGCLALKLAWVPLFETGINVDSANAGVILEELDLLRRWMAQQTGYDYESERISCLIAGLENARSNPDLESFIG